jgi:uncharacterized protein (DUF58 family)
MILLPTRRSVLVAAAWLGICVLSAALILPETAWQYGAGAVAMLLLADAVLVLRRSSPGAQREAPSSMAHGRWHDVTVTLSNPGRTAIDVELYDHHPSSFETRDLPCNCGCRPRAGRGASMRCGPTCAVRSSSVRSRSECGRLWACCKDRCASARLRRSRSTRTSARSRAIALLATDHRLSQIGVLQRRRRGEGMDFHQLREYRLGDSLKRIDWKATSRMHRLISREYQDERDQTILLVLDCGRRMTAVDAQFSHFDAALDAALLLAHVGLHHGDAVGAITMAGDSRFFAPRKGPKTVASLLELLYDLQPSMRTPDYYAAAIDIMRRISKRALVVFISNLRDEDDDTLRPALALLRRRHLVLFASLRERVLSETLSKPVRDLDSALIHAATADYLQSRKASFGKLEQAGALMMDVEPQQLAIRLVNRYLEAKRSGML